MRAFSRILGWTTVLTVLAVSPITTAHAADDWTISGMVLSPTGIIADGAISISKQMIAAVGPSASIPSSPAAVKVKGIILPGFIDLHDHLTWNVLPRWVPARKFNNRYEWQDTAEYDRALVAPHNIVLADAACEAEIYAEVKALAGGATSVIGGLLADDKHPDNAKCVAGLARNLDTASGMPFTKPDPKDPVCPTGPATDRTLLDVVENDVFPLELMHGRMEFLLCELKAGTLRGMVVHLSEGAPTDSAAHREYTMLSREILRQKDLKTGIESAIEREGLIIIHGTALRDPDFKGMKESKVGLVWSPRSNDELYGSTVNLAAAHLADLDIAIAPDWSPSGSAGMLQEMGYAARHYGVKSDDLLKMATSMPAKMARITDYVGSLAPNKFADFVVINVAVDPTKATALDPVVKATPADIALVVVGGQPIYGDPALLTQLLPTGTAFDQLTVCGATKAIYLGQSEAGVRGWGIADIKKALNAALAKGSSILPDIECD